MARTNSGKMEQSNDGDEQNLLADISTKNNSSNPATLLSPNNINKKSSDNTSPRDVRQIDSSFSFAALGDGESDDDSRDNSNIDIEQTLLAISSFEMNTDEFKDEDDSNSEFTRSTHHFLATGPDTSYTYAHFVPGVDASLSMDQNTTLSSSNHSILCRDLLHSCDNSAVEVGQVVQPVLKQQDDVEAQLDEGLRLQHEPTNIEAAVGFCDITKDASAVTLSGPANVSLEAEDSFNTEEDNGEVGDGKELQAKRNRRCLIAAILLFIGSLVIVVSLVVSRAKRRRNDASNSKSKCSFCADGTLPSSLNDKAIKGSDTSCSALMEQQVFLQATESQCQQGQALAWMFCGCPTLPSETSTDIDASSCSYCPDGISPVGHGCADFNKAVRLAGSSSFITCDEAISMVPHYCSCPNLDPIEQFSRLLRPISGKALEDATTPQFQAFEWIANKDPANLVVEQDSTTMIQHRFVAAVVYYSLGGSEWTDQTKFLSADDICQWNIDTRLGMYCDDNDDITSIRLPDNGLVGEIPPEISFFSKLDLIDMQSNNIDGAIPTLIASLEALDELDLNDNALTGRLPSALFDLPALRIIDLSWNKLVGELPPSFGSSTSLESLLLRGNDINGTLPAAIGSSTVLQSLDLDSNNITGPLPDFSSSSPMRQLFVGNNSLTGPIPPSIGTLRQLQILSAVNNDLSGTLPAFSENDERLIVLELSKNRLSGNLQQLLNTAPPRRMTHIQIEDNLLTGSIPKSLGLFSNLVDLRLGRNKLTGTIPTEIGELNDLMQAVSLPDNRLTGTIPSSIGHLTKLGGTFDLSSNQLSGTIPMEIGRLRFMTELVLADNLLSGTMPLQLSNLQNLFKLHLSNNNIHGDIGMLLSNLPVSLQTVNLNTNLLWGTIPPLVGVFQQLEKFELFSNNLSGFLPSEFGLLSNMRSLQLSENSLSGTIPPTIGDCTALRFLSLGDNYLVGTIPTELVKLTALERFFVAGNSLSGSLDFLCTPEKIFDYVVANSCGVNESISCSCCTHCCDPTVSSCEEI